MPNSHPGAAVILILAALGALAGCGEDSPEPQAAPTSPSTEVSTQSEASAGPQHLSEDLPGVLPAGNYQFSFLSDSAVSTDAVITVADGFTAGATWYVVPLDQEQFLGTYAVAQVERDACGKQSELFDPGPTVQDLAAALGEQKSTRASAPRPVTLDGHEGLYLEILGPKDLDTCPSALGMWDGRGIYSDGQVDMVWILDVDGQRLVVDASYAKAASSPADIKALRSMVESLRFVPAE